MSRYKTKDYSNRREYLDWLAESYGVDRADVVLLASILGTDQDFDGLPSTLADLPAAKHTQGAVFPMFANSEFLVLFNQAATDRAELAKLLNISENQMGYVTNAEAGHGLLRVGGAIVPFANEFPRTGALYQLWNTTPTDK